MPKTKISIFDHGKKIATHYLDHEKGDEWNIEDTNSNHPVLLIWPYKKHFEYRGGVWVVETTFEKEPTSRYGDEAS